MKTLIYAGVNRGESFFPMVENFELCIGFEANPALVPDLGKKISDKALTNVSIVNAALGRMDGEAPFYINDNDCTSSMGKINNEIHPTIRHLRTIRVRTINLFNFLKGKHINTVDMYVSDLQGMDLIVLKTLKPLLDRKRVRRLQCEVGKDDRPSVYEGLYNGFRGFQALLSENYVITQHRKVPEDFTEDIVWQVKG